LGRDGIEAIEKTPGIQWKPTNIRKICAEKRAELLEKLYQWISLAPTREIEEANNAFSGAIQKMGEQFSWHLQLYAITMC
jgi:hypothetical protein